MRATRAYIASAGTAVVMLGASLAMLTFVSAFVAFGSWPGQDAGSRLDQVVLNEVAAAKAKPVPVRTDAVKVARRADAQRTSGAAGRQGAGSAPSSDKRTAARTPAGTPLASAPGAAAPATRAAPGAVQGPADTVKQQTQGVTQQIDTTTGNVGTQVQTQVQQVQTQVNEVVDQVAGAVPPPASTPVQQVQTTVTTVTDTAGSLLGH